VYGLERLNLCSAIYAEYRHAGPMAVHLGHCRTRGRDFSYMPNFLYQGTGFRVLRSNDSLRPSRRPEISREAMTI
jgi:hypothetical protein